jgi:hypothetical protein
MERAKGSMSLMRYRFSSLPEPQLAGHKTCVFVTVNKAWRYLATSINAHEILFKNLKTDQSIDDRKLLNEFQRNSV